MEITVRRAESFGIVSVKGRIIRENQAELRKRLEDLVADGVKGISLDFLSVDYMDSAGLGCCASVQKLLRDKGAGALAMFGASQSIQKMWKLIRLDLVIPIFKEEKEALTWLGTQAPGAPS
ncbi:MAG: STAS domain-containing protein [Planctomycetes bacterium]|nr:STAS domain-containing protein [Planctomycetota bacterium]